MSNIASKFAELISDQIRTYFSNNKMQVDVLSDCKDVFFFDWMSLILIANPEFRCLIKVHCNQSDVRSLAQTSLSSAGFEECQDLTDFVKEMANLLGGSVKRSLEGSNFQVGLSLPLMIKGFDELFSNFKANSDRTFIVLEHEGRKILVQVNFEFLNEKVREKLKNLVVRNGMDKSGEFEFL